MRKVLIVISVVVLGGVGAAWYFRGDSSEPAATAGRSATGGATDAAGGGGAGQAGAGAFRAPMTVELATPKRAPIAERIMVVGNLIGAATVEVVAKISGRLESISVRLGDPVRRGQQIARVEDQEIQEQVKQAEASYAVAQATIRQREASLKMADTNLERTRSLFKRQLVSQQTLDDAEANQQSDAAQLDLARAQFDSAKARLEELKVNLANTIIVSPVDGFVGSRNVDPGAYVSSSVSTAVCSVVDIRFVRMVVNLVEKDLRTIATGMPADVEVDAYPGEVFKGKVARVAPVLDPATRTAQMEVEVPNPQFRLKPGMYARVSFAIAQRENALVVPRNAVVNLEGRRGVFVATKDIAKFQPIESGLEAQDLVEVTKGLSDGEQVVTTGSGALRDGDRIVLAGVGPGGAGVAGAGSGGGRGTGQGGPPPQNGQAPAGGRPPASR